MSVSPNGRQRLLSVLMALGGGGGVTSAMAFLLSINDLRRKLLRVQQRENEKFHERQECHEGKRQKLSAGNVFPQLQKKKTFK